MLPAAAIVLIGVWLVAQTAAGRLPARLLSWRAQASGLPTVSADGWTTPAEQGEATTGPNGLPSMPATRVERDALNGKQVARLVLSLGLDEKAATMAVAIAWRESRFIPTAHNDNPATRDDSYGLWQINRLAHPQYSPAELMTPVGNAKAMVALSSGGKNWGPWTVPGGSPTTGLDLNAAREHVAAAKVPR